MQVEFRRINGNDTSRPFAMRVLQNLGPAENVTGAPDSYPRLLCLVQQTEFGRWVPELVNSREFHNTVASFDFSGERRSHYCMVIVDA